MEEGGGMQRVKQTQLTSFQILRISCPPVRRAICCLRQASFPPGDGVLPSPEPLPAEEFGHRGDVGGSAPMETADGDGGVERKR